MPETQNRPGQTSVTFLLSNERNADLAAIMQQERRDRSFVIREAIDEYIARRKPADAATD